MPLKVLAVVGGAAIVLFSPPTVMFGGFSLLRLGIGRRLNDFQATYFPAGHAHAGVLLVACLLDRLRVESALMWTLDTPLLGGKSRRYGDRGNPGLAIFGRGGLHV
jgi:hypothetical protein